IFRGRERMVTQPYDPPLRKVIDSTVMLYIARFAIPLLVTTAVSTLGWIINDLKTGQKEGLGELREGQHQVWIQIGRLAETQATTNNVQSGLAVKVDSAVKQLDHLQVEVDSLQKH